jgi:hypothetical protein
MPTDDTWVRVCGLRCDPNEQVPLASLARNQETLRHPTVEDIRVTHEAPVREEVRGAPLGLLQLAGVQSIHSLEKRCVPERFWLA